MDHAILAEQHGLHVRRVADADDDHIASRGQCGRRRGRPCPRAYQVCRLARSAVPDGQVVAGLQQIAAHPLAHDAQADKTCFFAHLAVSFL